METVQEEAEVVMRQSAFPLSRLTRQRRQEGRLQAPNYKPAFKYAGDSAAEQPGVDKHNKQETAAYWTVLPTTNQSFQYFKTSCEGVRLPVSHKRCV